METVIAILIITEVKESPSDDQDMGEDNDSMENIDIEGLPSDMNTASGDLDFNLQKEAFEKDFIIRALKTFKGKVNQTALLANIPKKLC